MLKTITLTEIVDFNFCRWEAFEIWNYIWFLLV